MVLVGLMGILGGEPMLGRGRRGGAVWVVIGLVGGILAGTGLSAAPAAAASPLRAARHCVPGPDADLVHCHLNSLNLSGADLEGADLTDADLKKTNLRNANLTGADLRGTVLIRTVLTGAALTGVTSGDTNGTPASLPTNWVDLD